jgi:hypothetical protein
MSASSDWKAAPCINNASSEEPPQIGWTEGAIKGSVCVVNGCTIAPRVALPSDLSASLRFLDDADLQRLLAAVNTEIDRQRRGASTPGIGSTAPVTGSRPVPVRDEHTNIAEIPEGKANLIRAAFGAGLKTPAIAPTFGISLSQVNRVIRSTGKPHR